MALIKIKENRILATLIVISLQIQLQPSLGEESCHFEWIGDPDPTGTITMFKEASITGLAPSLRAEIGTYDGNATTLDQLFQTALANPNDYLFAPPINTTTYPSARVLGDAFYGSVWFQDDNRTYIHRGIDLAVGSYDKNNPTKVTAISNGEVYYKKSDDNDGDTLIVRYELELDRVYPAEEITAWQQINKTAIDPHNPPPASTEVYPLSSRIRPFFPGTDSHKYLFIAYLHLAACGKSRPVPVV